MAALGGKWLRESSNSCALVFVHGVMSSNQDAWRSPDAFWPDLVLKESELAGYGVYLFDYDTDAAPGNNDLYDATNTLFQYLRSDRLLDLRQIIFVAHSAGGIIARKLAVLNVFVFKKNKISLGFFLVASPSLGSKYANLFRKLVCLRNLQIDQLRFSQSNMWLNELNVEFTNLKERKPFRVFGRELIEADPVCLPRALLSAAQIVTPISAARYFGEPLKIPKSNHRTIAKPASARALQHMALLQLVRENPPEDPLAEAPAKKVSEPPVDAPAVANPNANISFFSECIVDEDSVNHMLAHPELPFEIEWHSSLQAELFRLDDWLNNFDVKSKGIKHAGNIETHRAALTRSRLELQNIRRKITRTMQKANPMVQSALAQTNNIDFKFKKQCVIQVIRLLTLKLIYYIQHADYFTIDNTRPVHISFPTLQRVPDALIDIVPKKKRNSSVFI